MPECNLLHQIQGAAEPGAVADGHLLEAVEWMRGREVDYRIPVCSARPEAAEAESWLGRRGYERGRGWVKLVRDVAPPAMPEVPGITIYKLGEDEADGEGLSTIAAEAAGMPPTAGTLLFSLPQRRGWHCYTAASGPDEPPVAVASTLIDGDIAQLGPGGTLECGRGRGCQAALLRRRLLDLLDSGCHTVFVELGECGATELSAACRRYERAGFELVCESRNWQRPALHPAAVHH